MDDDVKPHPDGREYRKFSADEIEKIEGMAGCGLNMQQIGYVMKLSKKTLERGMVQQESLRDAVDRGRAIAILNVGQVCYKMARSGKNPSMTQFYLRTRAGWTEKSQVEISGKAEIVFATRIGPDGVLRKTSADKEELSGELLDAAYADLPADPEAE